MSSPSALLLLRLNRLDSESGLFASFPTSPTVPLLRFAPLPTTGRRILETMGALDENAARLISNFERRFPRIYRAVESIGRGLPDGEERSLFFFLSVCCIALQVEEADLRDAGSLSSGLQVDYALTQERGDWFVDTRTTLRSLWSYKLAEVPNALLLFSLFESLGQTLGTFAGRCGELLQTQTLRLSGDLEGHPFFRTGLRRGLPRKVVIEEDTPASATPPPDGLTASGPPDESSGPFSLPTVRLASEGVRERAED